MKRLILGAMAVLGVAGVTATGHAHDRTQWSVTIGNEPRGVVVPQSQYSYGAPPSIYTPPPIYAPPPVYVAPPPVIYVQPPPYPVYVNPAYGHRHDWNDRRDWNDHRRDWNDRRPGQWGYGSGQGQGYYRR